jgi:hypothetical protein
VERCLACEAVVEQGSFVMPARFLSAHYARPLLHTQERY